MHASSRLIVIALIVAATAVTAAAQRAIPESRAIGAKIDYSYCRFDSTTEALCDQVIPSRIFKSLATFDGKSVPFFLAAKDFTPADTGATYKLIYASDGMEATLTLLKRDNDGRYTKLEQSLRVGTLHHVHLRFTDVNGDGRQDIIASCVGDVPEMMDWSVFELLGDGLRPMTKRPFGPADERSTFGVGVGLIDSLGQPGRPAIEVWQDDSTHFGQRFVRIVQQYNDSIQVFIPTTIDTVSQLPFWCKKRREKK